jgi:pimeloyl-ACP methyl ester carboxylesterase
LYPRLAAHLAEQHIASLRLHYRHPNELLACVMAPLLGVAYLRIRSLDRVVLVGHSFGGAVVICAGALGGDVAGVAALSSQTYGTDLAADLSSQPCG